MIFPVFNAALLIFFVIILGGFLRSIKCLKPEADESLTAMCINVLYPCMIFDKISKTDIPSHWTAFGIAPVLGFLSLLIPLIVVWMFVKLPGRVTGLRGSEERSTFMASGALYNYGYLPIPILSLLYPGEDEIMTGLFIFTLGVELAVWSLIVPCMAGGFQKGWWKKMLSVPFITIVVAVTLNCLGWIPYIPESVRKTVEWIGLAQLTFPCIIIGAIMYDQICHRLIDFRAGRTYQTTLWCLFFRCILFPVLMIYAASFFAGNPILQKILVIQAAMPTAMMIVLFARMYGGSPAVGIQAILSTSLLSPLVAVFWITQGMRWLGLAAS